jgi:hypothetical protein
MISATYEKAWVVVNVLVVAANAAVTAKDGANFMVALLLSGSRSSLCGPSSSTEQRPRIDGGASPS